MQARPALVGEPAIVGEGHDQIGAARGRVERQSGIDRVQTDERRELQGRPVAPAQRQRRRSLARAPRAEPGQPLPQARRLHPARHLLGQREEASLPIGGVPRRVRWTRLQEHGGIVLGRGAALVGSEEQRHVRAGHEVDDLLVEGHPLGALRRAERRRVHGLGPHQ
jgi:hypothetical protein